MMSLAHLSLNLYYFLIQLYLNQFHYQLTINCIFLHFLDSFGQNHLLNEYFFHQYQYGLINYHLNNIPLFGISQGIDNILKSKVVLVVASGKEKAEGIKKLIKGGVDKEIPLTALKKHLGDVYVVADEDACSLI